MADTKISQLAEITTLDGTESVPVVPGGVNKRSLLSTVKAWVLNTLAGASNGQFVALGVQSDGTGGSDGTLRDSVGTSFGTPALINAAGTALMVGGGEIPIDQIKSLSVANRSKTGLEGRSGSTYAGAVTKKHMYRRFVSLAGVTITGGATAEIVTLNGIRCLKVTTVAGTNAEVQVDGENLAGPLHDTFVWRVKFEDHAKVDSVTPFMSKSSYAGWWSAGFTIAGSGNIFDHNDWQQIPLHRNYGSSSGTGFSWDTDTMDQVKFRVVPEPGQVAVVYFHSAALYVKESRPKIIIGFDDNHRALMRTGFGASATVRGTAGTYTHRQILDAYGYKGTLWMVTGFLSGDRLNTDTLNWDEIRELFNDGWDVQIQSHFNPGDSTSVAGNRLLGPYGYATRGVSAVAPASDAFTSNAHGIYLGSYAYPLEFVGSDLPSGIVSGITYYARGVDANTFKIFSTEADSLANTNPVNLTDTGIPANYGWRYGGSVNDDGAIYADFMRCRQEIADQLSYTPWLIAYNQGAVDEYVRSAAHRAGMLFGRTTERIKYRGLPAVDRQDVMDFGPHPQDWTIQLDEATARDVTYYATEIASAVDVGLNIFTYAHGTTATTAQNLANFCEAAHQAEVAGTVEVCTASEAYRNYVP